MNILNKSSGFCTSLQMFIEADESSAVIFFVYLLFYFKYCIT